MHVSLLLGDEAVAQGAIDAGIAGAFSYPGTPATEVFEYIQPRAADRGISAIWSANEKVAYEEALGMSYAGRRALVSMKHVGLNVAADPFMNSALTGINGGVVLVVADDPGMHSSQNEQDSRFYAEFAQIPVFEPADQQQAYDMTRAAFDYSERVGLPVMVRVVTRLAHSRSNVEVPAQPPARPPQLDLPNADDWTLVPGHARRRFRHLLGLQPGLQRDSDGSQWNTLRLAGHRGVITCGIGRNYAQESVNGNSEMSHLHIGMYPLPTTRIRELVDHCDELLIIEDGYPFVERRLMGLLGLPGKAIRGRLSGDLPASGELSPDVVGPAMGRPLTTATDAVGGLAARPPQLCKGCPHADTFKAMIEATGESEKAVFFGDIGCYTLGVMPPYRAVHACVDMGASIAMAHGASQAGLSPVICTIGDSTFAHSGMTPLIGAARADADMTVFILDNATVAMTGAQESMTTGDRLLDVLKGLGVAAEHIHVVDPKPRRHAHNVAIMQAAVAHRGLSVVIAARPCIHLTRKTDKQTAAA